jgi:hypothetical protein
MTKALQKCYSTQLSEIAAPSLAYGHESHADLRLRGDARGRDVIVRQELAAGMRKNPAADKDRGSGVREAPSFQSTPLVEGISVRGSAIERALSRRVPGKAARKENAK